MFVDCILVVICHPLGLVSGFNAICNACLAGVPSGSLKMCPVDLSVILSVHESCIVIMYISVFVIIFGWCMFSKCLKRCLWKVSFFLRFFLCQKFRVVHENRY